MSVRTDVETGVRPRPPGVGGQSPGGQSPGGQSAGGQGAPEPGIRGKRARGQGDQVPGGQGGRASARSPSPVLPGRSRPARRRATGPGSGRPAGPGQGRPVVPAPERAVGQLSPPGTGAPSAAIARTPFILFVTALLAGGLVCLLVINTILATGSYQISSLQQAQTARAQQVQALKQQVAEESAPSVIARRARELGLAEPPLTKFLNLNAGRIIRQPATERGVPAVPGYTP